tara:strand:+ start:298 stop:636 length:339 start_codon:yes stop_codon:yes gene_type:complete
MNLNLQLHKLLLTSLIILLNTVVFSQDRKSKTIELNKNLIYGSVSVGNDLFAKAFYYDRILKGNIFWGKDILPIVKIGIGQHKAFEYNDGNYVTIQYGIISATETSHHFEIV